MFTGAEILGELTQMGCNYVIWIPDTDLGRWENDLRNATDLRLLRVCREGEAWPLAAGLLLGGQRPIVLMQTTGLFESGDALRNVAYDLRLPVFALVGARNQLNPKSTDSARRFGEAILKTWEIPYVTIESRRQLSRLASHYYDCQARQQPGIVLLSE